MTAAGEETRCIAVVDGSLILTDAGPIAYDGVTVPRVPMPGGAYLRIVNQRLVQDRTVSFERIGEARGGHIRARVWVDGESVNDRINAEVAALGLPAQP